MKLLQSIWTLMVATSVVTYGVEKVPNILLILTDDQGYGDISLHNNPVVETPNLDRFAKKSVELIQFHAAPVCAPTRASLMTGKHFLRAGVWGVHGGRDYLDLSETTLADRLRTRGYRTAMAGKWHLGKTEAYLPHNRGFDQAWTITDRLYQHTDPIIDHNGEELKPQGWTVDILTESVLNWMKQEDDKPFFCYLAQPYIHEPYYAPAELIKKYLGKGLSESMATLCAMTEHLDQTFGYLLKELGKAGLMKSTMVLFLGDNGPIGNPVNLPHLTREELALRNPTGLKGLKGNLYENGTRAPCFVSWPETFMPAIVEKECDITDLVPTLLDLANVEYDVEVFDGRSLIPMLTGQPDAFTSPSRYYANHEVIWPGRERLYDFLPSKNELVFENQVLAIRQESYKYIMGFGRNELFNIEDDPQELHNLAAQKPEIIQTLRSQLKNWWENEVLPLQGSYSMPTYVLPHEKGRTIRLHPCSPIEIYGEITPGSHFSHEWKRSGDGIGFSIKVPKKGTYRAEAWMEVKDTAGVLTITAKNYSISAKLQTSHIQQLGSLLLSEGEQLLKVQLQEANSSSVKISQLEAIQLTRISD